jgi:hypothetical protein
VSTGTELGQSFFNACILRYNLSKPLTSLNCSLNAVLPGLKMWDTFARAMAFFLTFVWPEPGLEPGPPAWQAVALTAQPSTTPKVSTVTELGQYFVRNY